jgi:DUF1680 family protein
MFLLHGDARYIDVLERSLYNGLVSGVSLDGKSFFYTNAMQVKRTFTHRHLETARSGWFDCSCCPTNIARLLPSVTGYMYAQKDHDIYVNLFATGEAHLKLGHREVVIEQRNNYPWDGDLQFEINPRGSEKFGFRIRIPGWAQRQAVPGDLYRFEQTTAGEIVIKVNGQPVDYEMEQGYAVLNRTWRGGDVVTVSLPMEVQRVVAHEKLADNQGRVALQRGPIVYCAEGHDNFGRAANILIPQETSFKAEFRPELLQGVMVLKSVAPVLAVNTKKNRISTAEQPFTAIPYYAWANRGKSEMMVWFPMQVADVEIITK